MMRLTPAFREKILLNFSFILSVFLKNRVALQLVQQKPSLIMVEYWKMKLKKTDILSSVTGFSYNIENDAKGISGNQGAGPGAAPLNNRACCQSSTLFSNRAFT